MSDTIRVLVVDDQEIIRRALAAMLGMEPDIEVVGLAADGAAAVDLARRHVPDVVLMDIKMPGMNGIRATRIITDELKKTQVVILTTFDADDLVFDAIRSGAQAYLLKDASEAEVLDVIRGVSRGESRLSPNVARKVMDEFRRMTASSVRPRPDDAPAIERLTEREAEILGLVAQGKSNKEICSALYLSEGTVKNYVSRIMAKLHANDRTQLAIKALKTGYATLSG